VKLLKRWVLAFVVPKPLIGIFYLPRYWRDWRRYRAAAPPRPRPLARDMYPCLVDWTASTPFDPHYFYQGAWLARRLRDAVPRMHVDIGSSVVMLSVLSAQVTTVFVDYRPLRASLPNLLCVGGSILALPFDDASVGSLSCLHVIEHIGLGRYGDAIDPAGSERAAAELARVLAPGGRLYLSTPVGREQVCFNAHRVFAPGAVVRMFATLEQAGFALVDDAGRFHPEARLEDAAGLDYGCGMYVFTKS
jgi:SAM-dependent methyltransferase